MNWCCFCLLAFSTFSLLADEPPITQPPNQLQFMQPDSVQEDLLGKVKSVEDKSYLSANGTKSASDGRSLDTYDAQGGSLEKSDWEESGNLKRKTVTTYDAQGNLTGRKKMDASEAVVSVTTISLDPTSKKTTDEIKSADGVLQSKRVTIYDNYGKEKEGADFDSAGNITRRCTMQRNSEGKEVTVIFYGKDGQVETRIDVTWNPDGSQATETFAEDSKGMTTRTVYDYPAHDTQGNWTTRLKKTTFEKGGEVIGEHDSMDERVIAYY